MNVKVLMWVLIVLVIVFMAVYLFVPKNLDMTTGKLTTFKASEDAPVTPVVTTPITNITNQ